MAATETKHERDLKRDEKRLLALLGLPTLTLALAITVVTTYVPKLASNFTSSTTIIGLIVGAEGFLALWIPLIAGAWSDRLDTRVGRRMPFMIVATPPLVAALVVVGFVNSLAGIAVAVFVFFFAYFVAYEPYRALYPDLVEDDVAGRAQSTQAVWRGAGTGIALVGGGLLFGLTDAAPFVAAGALVAIGMTVFVVESVKRRPKSARTKPPKPAREVAADLWDLLRRDGSLRAYLLANALWELSLGALKTFVVLYITNGLGYSVFAAAAIVGAVALVVLAAAPVSGKMADRMGSTAVMRLALPVYGAGLLVPLFIRTPWALVPILPVIAFGGGVIMTLPYAMLIPLMPKGEHGALTGFYSLSRGIGVMLGPLLAGVAVSALKGPLSHTHGYAAMWLVCSAAILASIPLVKHVDEDR
ncbi:MAG TPA: MFS transporter [Thermoleophilaceae bacterium]|nr:MFS transporter [Thermoleophilaceae bacterium]